MLSRGLTSTSYAVLGLLALRPWPTYELAKQMRRSLHYIWPRAESNLYAEPKRLVEAGLATADEEWVGERRRTIYSITERGRHALRAWLARPSGGPRYESEAALKAFFAENGSKEDLLAAIDAIRASAEEGLAHWQSAADEYAEGRGPFPQRLHVSVLVARLLGEQHAAAARWAEWAAELVSRWDDTRTSPDVDWIPVLRGIGDDFPELSDAP